MTFYEAALRVLELSAKPLTHVEITQQSIDKGLLSHIGKTPEVTMLSRLAAMAKRPKDRRVIVTAPDTFALSEWQLPEDAVALAATGVIEPNPEEAMPAYRPNERHPEPRGDNVRAVGRSGDRDRKHHRRDREEEREQRRRKYPPIAEVAFEVLTEGGVLAPTELLDKARAKELVSNELSVEQLLNALLEDNQRRIDSGRRPQFASGAAEAGAPLQLKLDASETPGNEVQLALAQAAGVPVENGRPVLRSRSSIAVAAATLLSADDLQLIANVKVAGKDARRAMARLLRKKLSEVDGGTLEKSVVRMLHGLSFREVKVARRSKEGPVLTARRREGSLELRYAIRICKGPQGVERRQVQELRKDLSHYGANVGLIVSGGEARGDARAEALNGALVFLWCGEGLAERFFEAQVGVTVQTVELYEIDEAFFTKAQVDAEDARARREERSRERDRQEPGEGGPAPHATPVAGESVAPASPPRAAQADDADGGDDQGDDSDDGEDGSEEGGEVASSAPGVPGAPPMLGPDGQPLRKRRRRRRRRGRGPRPDQPGGVPGAPGAQVSGAPVPAASPSSPSVPAAPSAPAPAPAASAPPPPAPSPSGEGNAT